MNNGFWVFDKQGNVKTYQNLLNFWGITNPGGAALTDTQIAYDRSASLWYATTIEVNTNKILFAVSKGPDATILPWNFFSFSNPCPGNEDVDQPILGYSKDWVATEYQCAFTTGPNKGYLDTNSDQVVFIKHSSLAQNPPSVGSAAPTPAPFFGARPSRDVANSGSQPLFLVGSAPFGANTGMPYVQVAQVTVDASGNPKVAGFGSSSTFVTSPTVGVLGNAGPQPVHQKGCTPFTSCDIKMHDSRIDSVYVQTGNDGNHYLLTAFDFADSTNSTTQSLFFVGKIDTFSSGSPAWNTASFDSASVSYGYPTIAMDKDLLVSYTYTAFDPTKYITPNWNAARGFNPTNGQWPNVLGYGAIPGAASLGTYTGDPTQATQRWGDYMTTVWDPTIGTPRGGFWTVQEYSPGGPIESTEMVTLQDPAPYYVGYTMPPNGGESECIVNGSISNPCGLTFSAPAGAQPGDVLVATLGEYYKWGVWDPKQSNAGGLQVPSGWTLVPTTFNGATAPQLYSYTNFNDWTTYTTTYLAVYQYQSNDPGSYQFIMHFGNTGIGSEIGGFLVSYRGASGNLANYAANGWPSFQVSTSQTTGGIPAANGDNTLLTVFGGNCIVPGFREETPYVSFTAPTGFPQLAVETPFFDGGEIPFIAADVAFGAGQQVGSYSANSCNVNYQGTVYGGQIFAYQMPIPDGSGLPTSAGHPLFFAGEIPLPGQFFLNFADWKLFGYYDYTYWPSWINHHDLGMEWYVDANDGLNGAWLSDCKLGQLYTNPADFPTLWNNNEGDWWSYWPDSNNPGHYTTKPRVFWDYGNLGNGGSVQPQWVSSSCP